MKRAPHPHRATATPAALLVSSYNAPQCASFLQQCCPQADLRSLSCLRVFRFHHSMGFSGPRAQGKWCRPVLVVQKSPSSCSQESAKGCSILCSCIPITSAWALQTLGLSLSRASCVFPMSLSTWQVLGNGQGNINRNKQYFVRFLQPTFLPE